MNSPPTFTQLIMRRLCLWSALSASGGMLLQARRSSFWIGVGQ